MRRRRPARVARRLLTPRWRRHPIATAVLLLVAVVAVWLDRTGRLGSRGDDYGRYHDRQFRVVHVVDGDTFDINAPDGDKSYTRIRLWGVDTPEVAGSPAGEMYYGPEASAFAKETLDGRDVRIELAPDKSRDKYGRLLAYAYRVDTGAMFNEELISTGHAYADSRFPHAYAERFRTLEERAARAGVGLWKDVRPDQMPAWRQRRDAARSPSAAANTR